MRRIQCASFMTDLPIRGKGEACCGSGDEWGSASELRELLSEDREAKRTLAMGSKVGTEDTKETS